MKVLAAAILCSLFVATFSAGMNATASLQSPARSGAPSSKTPTDVQQSAPSEPSAAQKYFTDVELFNQNGEKMRFYSDLLKGHTVVIIPFFTSCTAVCPPMNATMRRVQEALGNRVGKDVYLISITVDPAIDTPARLKDYAAKFMRGRAGIS